MKRTFVVIILFYFILQVSESQEIWKQQRLETVAGFGMTQFFGDIGGFSKGENIIGIKDFSFLQTRYNISAGAKYRILRDLNIRFNLAYGKLFATDKRGSNEARNFEAKTTIFEPSIMAEYYFIKSGLGDSYLFNQGRSSRPGNLLSALEFYVFTGVGGLSYNSKGNPPLVAKGLKNSGFAAVIPVGVGVNLLFKPQYNLGVELGGRYALSDYLDGYKSQYSSSNDVYYFLNVTFTYKIKTNTLGVPLFLNKRKF
jgi:hypothetical protein